MLDIGSTELLMVIIVAIVVIGPKDLPRALYKLGQVVGKAKGVARHFRTGIDAMVREVELEEMEKKWKADNERIMREHAALAPPATATATAAASNTPEAAPAMQPLPPADPTDAAPVPDSTVTGATAEAAPPVVPATEGER
ncbi:MAG: Sec-independent protein translocase protein TatB [Blastomonas sp.]